MTDLTPAEVYGPEVIDNVKTRLADGPVLLIGRVRSGADDVARHVGGEHGLVIDGASAFDYRTLVTTALRAVAGRLAHPLAPDQLTGSGATASRSLRALADGFGERLPEAMAAIDGGSADGWSLEGVLRALPQGTVIGLLAAHEIPAQPALWELRSLASDGQKILLTSTPAHVNALTGPDSAWFGFVHRTELPVVAPRRWARVLDDHYGPLHPSDLEWLLERARGRPATVLCALGFTEGGHSPRTAWRRAARAAGPRAHDVLRLAAAVHPYAPGLLLAISAGEPPYAAISGSSSQRVARALARLRDLDIVEQPLPRTWQIADPLLDAALDRVRRETQRPWADPDGAQGIN